MRHSQTRDIFSQRYTLHDQLGLGGMGAVYKATDHLTGDIIALKRVFAPVENLVFESYGDNEDLRVALAQEFQTLAGIRHPNIISVLEYGFDTSHQPYFTMELLNNARSIVGASRSQPDTKKVDYLIQMLQALDYLHRRGILHRDLKPGNVLVQDDQVKILDFGLAINHNTVPEEAVGTISYMAPELLEEQRPTAASDLFAVGIMTYELFAGQHPFDPSGNIMELIYRISMMEPEYDRIDLSRDAIQIIQKLLAKKPKERYQKALDVIEDLSRAFNRPLPEETDDIREGFLQAAQLVGREGELSLLESALEDLMEGQGSAWLIGGESGVGKTRLLEELRVRALVQGAHVVRGEATAEANLPYQLWRKPMRRLSLITDLSSLQIDVLRQLIPDIGTLLDVEPGSAVYEGRQALLDTIIGVLHQQVHPTVLILEDLQWVSESLEVLQRLCRSIEQFPILVLASYRNDERPSLPQEVPEIHTIQLDRLNASEIEQLAESMLGSITKRRQIINFLQEQTEGNTYFLVEVVRALAEEAGRLDLVGTDTLPIGVFTGGMQAIVQRRLQQVPAWGQGLLQLAAVIGREIDLKILQILLPTLEDRPDIEKWLISCANAAVLEVREGQWRFAHDKLREGVLRRLEPTIVIQQHQLIAEAIEQAYPNSNEHAARLARHWGAAGDREREWHYARLAGQQALQISAYREAIEFFNLALRTTADLNHEAQRPEILCRIGQAHRYLGDFERAEPMLREALTLASHQNDQATQTEAVLQLGSIARNQGTYEQSTEFFSRGLTLARTIGDRKSEAVALSQLGDISRVIGQAQAAIQYHEEALAIARDIGDSRLEGISLDNLGGVYSDAEDYDQAIRFREEALALFRAKGNRRSESIALTNLGQTLYAVGRYDEAIDSFHQALSISEEIGDLMGEGICLDALAEAYLDLGKLEQAEGYYMRSLTIMRSVGNRRHESNRLYDLARIAIGYGKPTQAIELATKAYQISVDLEDEDLQCLYSITQGWAFLATDKLDEARAALYRAAVTLGLSEHGDKAAAAYGVACLRADENDHARNAFRHAITRSQEHLAAKPNDYQTYFNLGLAHCGLFLLGDEDQMQAINTYQKARQSISHHGVISMALQKLFEVEKVHLDDISDIRNALRNG